MKNNDDHQQVVMSVEAFRRMVDYISPQDFKHLRKFNTSFRSSHQTSIALNRTIYRIARDKVLALTKRQGKIVFVMYKDREFYVPMQLVGIDPKNKTKVRVRSLYHHGMRVVDGRAWVTSVEGNLVHASINKSFVYWSSGPFVNTFTPDNDSPHSKATYDEYMKQWAEALK